MTKAEATRHVHWFRGMKTWLEYQLVLDLYDAERIQKTTELERINELLSGIDEGA